ncbi:MAG: serpin family protein [Acidimicrobiales bacterium]|jgi:serpin B
MERSDDRIDRALATLGTTTVSADWVEPSALRHKSAVRRIWRRGVGIGSVVIAVVAAATLIPIGLRGNSHSTAESTVTRTVGSAIQLVSHSGNGGPAPTSERADAVADSEQQFSLSLLKQLSASESSPSNILVSPSSLSTALAMLELGAEGDTQEQIADTLGSQNVTPQEQAAGWSALDAELEAASAPDGIALQSANSLWLQKGLAMNPTFMSSLSRYFASGVWQVDFASDPAGAVADLNAWVARETHGHITTLFGPGAITNQTALILANAVYFKARWEQPFASSTDDAPFHLPTGNTTSIPFVHTSANQPINASAFVGSGVDGVQLPYRGGRMAALVLMPTSGSVSEFSASLTQARLGQLLSSLAPSSLALSMPSLSLSSSLDLVSTLQALGMNDPFDASRADFSGMSPTSLVVTDVVQKDTLDVTPWGSEATAATGISMGTAAELPSMTITIDHPYLFLIRDTQTGEILFEAQVVNPAGG